MNKTKIEWVRNPDGTPGYTWNPITGCLNHINGMCKGGGFPCYAYRLANGRLLGTYLWNDNVAEGQSRSMDADRKKREDPFYPRFWPERLRDPVMPYYKGGLSNPRGIFPCDMSDLFGIGIPEAWTSEVLTSIKLCPLDRFYLLTKQPQNLAKFSPFPDNCWVGETITSCLDGLYYLKDIEAKVKFISFEPLLFYNVDPTTASTYLKEAGINWVILGSQTKPYKPPKIEWVEEIVRAADKARIPVFLKDNLTSLLGEALLPNELKKTVGINAYSGLLRQEMPK